MELCSGAEGDAASASDVSFQQATRGRVWEFLISHKIGGPDSGGKAPRLRTPEGPDSATRRAALPGPRAPARRLPRGSGAGGGGAAGTVCADGSSG